MLESDCRLASWYERLRNRSAVISKRTLGMRLEITARFLIVGSRDSQVKPCVRILWHRTSEVGLIPCVLIKRYGFAFGARCTH